MNAPLLAVLAAMISQAAQDDPDDRAFAARQTFVNNCLCCHSEELTTSQRLTSKQWKAEVEKMIGWGAPVPADQVTALIEDLAARYPDTAPPAPLARATPAEALAIDRQDAPSKLDGDPARGAPLYAAQCASCHGPEAKGSELGPNLAEKPVLLREDEYRQVVRASRRRMPGFAAVLDARQEADILAWLRGRR